MPMNREQLWDILESKVLPLVRKPGRYIGGEINMKEKNLSDINVRLALVFPDVYEIGMSNLGLQILYHQINAREDFYAERVFSPWIDLEEYLRKLHISIFSLETHSPLKEFDIIGFSLQYELLYTNVLNILDLAGIPLWAKDRGAGNYPLIIAGGQMASMPEPLAPFMDLFVVGDGEEVVLRIMEFFQEYGKKLPRNKFLAQIARSLDCVYVPSCYNADPDSSGKLTRIYPRDKNLPQKIQKNVLKQLNKENLPEKPVAPLIQIVHDRAVVEIMRGCPRACRFCQASVLYRPVRQRPVAEIIDYAEVCVRNTGYQELGLLSLSATDYNEIIKLTESLLEKWQNRMLTISLPSMRLDSFNLDLITKIARVKKSGITLAPEAASKKLLRVINKDYQPQDIIQLAAKAAGVGYRVIKLYFMIGLPGEELKDLDDLIILLDQVSQIGFKQVNVSISTLIPKPHTPFQWLAMNNLDLIREKQQYLRQRIKRRNIKLKFHDPYLSILEAVFGRGDRQLAQVVYKAWQQGARFDQWEECFCFNIWQDAFIASGLKMETYLAGSDYNDPLPWDHIDLGVPKDYLIKECEKALEQ